MSAGLELVAFCGAGLVLAGLVAAGCRHVGRLRRCVAALALENERLKRQVALDRAGPALSAADGYVSAVMYFAAARLRESLPRSGADLAAIRRRAIRLSGSRH